MLGSVRATDPAFAGGVKQANTPEQNTAAMQAALDTGRNVCVDLKGTPKLAPGLKAKAWGQTIFGQGPYQTVFDCRGDGDFFHNNGQHGFSVRDLGFTGSNYPAQSGGSLFVFDGTDATLAGNGQIIGGDLVNLRVVAMWNGALVRDINTLTITDVEMVGMNGDYGIVALGHNPSQRVDLIRATLVKYSPTAAARAAGRGTALYADGYIQTIDLDNFIAVRPYRGVHIDNTPGFGVGMRPAFVTAVNLQVDFPRYEALLVYACDRLKILGSYMHGSEEGTNVVMHAGVRDAKVVASSVTGAFHNNLYFDGAILDAIGVELDWASQMGEAQHHGILTGMNAQSVRVIGGGATDTLAAHGICRMNPATRIQLAAAEDHLGRLANRNF